jgi:hypothetical protein
MRVIYLTLLFFVIIGIGANCRTPPITGPVGDEGTPSDSLSSKIENGGD